MTFTELPDHGDLIALADFKEAVDCNAFIDYDGFGEMATETQTSRLHIKPSQVYKGYNFPDWCTHILWFNR